jgi:diadenosine tetraphosphate (Ap4A) HIT family hydrolase
VSTEARRRQRCVFCDPDALARTLLAATPELLIVADHAPLVPGHTLIITREHFPCYGAARTDLDDAITAAQQRVEAVLTPRYGHVVWFEHGGFHQTVLHAHLHALPLGEIDPSVVVRADLGGQRIATRDELRAWYASHGSYTFLSEAPDATAIFPAEERHYRALLGALSASVITHGQWRGPLERYLRGRPLVRDLIEAWRSAEDPSPAAPL